MAVKIDPTGLITLPNSGGVLGPPPGLLPGFDQSHIANSNNSNPSFMRGVSTVAVSGQGQHINLLTGARGTLTGTPGSVMSPFGPGITTTSTGRISFPASFASRQVTLACIVHFKTVPSAVQAYCCFTTGANSTTILCQTSGTLAHSYNSSATASFGLPAFIAGHTYFLAQSYNAITGTPVGNALQLDLNTGQLVTGTWAPTAASVSYTNFLIGNTGSGGGPTTANSVVLAAMGNFNYLSLVELAEWAQDPWAYWYPNKPVVFGFVPTAAPLPNNQEDWPLPPTSAAQSYNTKFRSWEQSTSIILRGLNTNIPKNQFDWPLPRSNWTEYANRFRDWTQNTSVILRGLNTNRPANQLDWPNPPRVPSYRDWGTNLLQTTLGIAAPFSQDDWPLPQRPYRPDFTWTQWNVRAPQAAMPGVAEWDIQQPPRAAITWTLNLLQSTLAPTAQAPFTQDDWPLPTAPRPIQQTWTWNQTPMLGRDQLPFSQQDWPTWRQIIRYRSWELNLLQTTLAPVAQPRNQYDWPLTRAPSRPDFSWTRWDVNAPQSAMAGAAWWEIPTRPARAAITWTLNLLQSTLATVQQPFAQDDWPLPQTSRPIQQTWTWNQTTMLGRDQLPVRQQEWPLAARPRPLTTEQVQNLLLTAFAPVILIRQTDWPLPQTRRPIEQTWLWNQTPMLGRDRLPSNQKDWPLPAPLPRQAITWGWNQTPMLGRDRLPTNQMDWPLPRGRYRPDSNWALNLLQTTLSQPIQLPRNQSDWIVPRRIVWYRDWNLNLLQRTLTPAVITLPRNQSDWPIPRAAARLRDYTWTRFDVSAPSWMPGVADTSITVLGKWYSVSPDLWSISFGMVHIRPQPAPPEPLPLPVGYESQVGVWHPKQGPYGRTGKRYRIYHVTAGGKSTALDE